MIEGKRARKRRVIPSISHVKKYMSVMQQIDKATRG
jgi:hypothetical protein